MKAYLAWRTVRDTWADPARLAQWRDARLRRLMQQAARVPFYRRLFAEAGVAADQIRTAADLSRLPVVTRAAVQAVPTQERIPDGIAPDTMTSYTTSGSTGHTVNVKRLPMDDTINDALTLRAYRRYGLRLGGRKLGIRSRPNTPPDRSWAARLGLMQRESLCGADAPDAWVAHCRRYRPHCLMLFMSVLRAFAEYLLDHGITDIRPTFLVSIGEILDTPTRQLIEQAFQAPVYDVYGSWESGNIAWECPVCDGYHIHSDWVILEVLRDDHTPAEPGEEGHAVLTNLHSLGMPFIRYEQGDRVVLHERNPTCGCHMPLLKHVCGRQTDLIIRQDGTPTSALTVLTLISATPGIGRYRLIQEADRTLHIQTVVRPPLADAVVTELADRLAIPMGGPVDCRVEYLDTFPSEPGHKFRRVISHAQKGSLPT